MIFRSTNGSVTASWSVWGQKCKAGSSGNARDESWKAKKGALPRISRQDTIVWLGELGLAAWLLGGSLAGMELLLFCILYYGRVMCNGMVCYCLSSCLPSECRVPSTLSSALYDLLRINANGSQPKPSPHTVLRTGWLLRPSPDDSR